MVVEKYDNDTITTKSFSKTYQRLEGEREKGRQLKQLRLETPKSLFEVQKQKQKHVHKQQQLDIETVRKKHTHQTSISSKHTVFICQLSFVSLHDNLLSLPMLPYCYNSPPPSLSPPLVFVFYLPLQSFYILLSCLFLTSISNITFFFFFFLLSQDSSIFLISSLRNIDQIHSCEKKYTQLEFLRFL